MKTNLLHQLKILAQLDVQAVGKQLAVAAVLKVMLTIEEPVRDLEVLGILHDVDNAFKFGLVEFTSTKNYWNLWESLVPLVHINFSLAANNTSITTTAALDGGEGKHDLLATINIGVEQTQNVLKATLFRNVHRLHIKRIR